MYCEHPVAGAFCSVPLGLEKSWMEGIRFGTISLKWSMYFLFMMCAGFGLGINMSKLIHAKFVVGKIVLYLLSCCVATVCASCMYACVVGRMSACY